MNAFTRTPGRRLGVLAVLLLAALAAAPVPLPANLAWGWPLAGSPTIVRGFDPPAKPWLPGHRGVDLLAPQGTAVLAPTDGVVAFSGVVVDRAVLTVAVADGLRLSFEPLASDLQAGDAVVRGQLLGVVEGPTHCRDPDAGCLHWGVRRGEEYVDPLQFLLDLRPSVLLPPRSAVARGRAVARKAGAGARGWTPPYTMAEMPVMARPVTRVLISYVPS